MYASENPTTYLRSLYNTLKFFGVEDFFNGS